MRDRIIGALETGCRQGEMQKVQNGDIDRHSHEIEIAKAHALDLRGALVQLQEPASLWDPALIESLLDEEARRKQRS